MEQSIFSKLKENINKSALLNIELEQIYSEYIEILMHTLQGSKLELELPLIVYDGENLVSYKLNSIQYSDKDGVLLNCSEKTLKWYEINIFSMDMIINNIHIALETEMSFAKLKNFN